MAEYIEREAAINWIYELINARQEWTGDARAEIQGLNAAMCGIEDVPAADVAPVVRCKDCKRSYEDLCGRVCSYGVCVDCVVPDDFFCADGAKMDGGNDG